MSKATKSIRTIVFVFLSGLALAAPQRLVAQEYSKLRVPVVQDPRTGKRFVQNINRSANEYDIKPMAAAAALPSLPLYTGRSTFICGAYLPNVTGGSTCYMRLRAMEDSSTVLNWYREVLRSNRWGLDSNATGSSAIAAILPGVGTCHIQTVPVVVEGYRCEFMIEFKQAGPAR